MISKVVPSVLVLLSISSARCFVINSEKPNHLQSEGCSSVFCSDSNLDDMYDNSKYLLSEIEMLLEDLRNYKITHELEQENNRRLDNEMKYITDKDFIKILYSDHDEEDDAEDEDSMNITDPVPFVHVHFHNDINNTSHQEDAENSNHVTIEDPNSSKETIKDEEEINYALSKLDEIQEEPNKNQNNSNYTKKRYLR